ncbi:MAG: polysaccharide pyruvyl transferase family protein [Armatimonadota bacterium]
MPITLLLLIGAVFLFRLFRFRFMWGTAQQRSLLAAYYDADLVLSCGGGNFYAHRPLSPAFIWALLSLAFALALRKPVAMLPQSFGPVAGFAQQMLARWTFSRVRLIMVRESRAGSFLREVLRVKTPIVLLPDMAFELSVGVANERVIGPASQRQIGVTAIDRGAQDPNFGGQLGYEEALCVLLTRLARERHARIHVFCQCFGPSSDQDDRPVARRLYQQLRQNGLDATLHIEFRDAVEIITAYSQLDMIVGTRMHTGIFALSSGVPVLLIGYQPKACGMMTALGFERYCCDIKDANANVLFELASEILAHEHELRVQIAERVREVRLQSNAWLDYVRRVLCHASE